MKVVRKNISKDVDRINTINFMDFYLLDLFDRPIFSFLYLFYFFISYSFWRT